MQVTGLMLLNDNIPPVALDLAGPPSPFSSGVV